MHALIGNTTIAINASVQANIGMANCDTMDISIIVIDAIRSIRTIMHSCRTTFLFDIVI